MSKLQQPYKFMDYAIFPRQLIADLPFDSGAWLCAVVRRRRKRSTMDWCRHRRTFPSSSSFGWPWTACKRSFKGRTVAGYSFRSRCISSCSWIVKTHLSNRPDDKVEDYQIMRQRAVVSYHKSSRQSIEQWKLNMPWNKNLIDEHLKDDKFEVDLQTRQKIDLNPVYFQCSLKHCARHHFATKVAERTGTGADNRKR
jgi:hypothetical protein